MAETEFEKTESPTPRRREEARQDGTVARSADLTAACVLLVGVLVLYWAGMHLLGGMKVTLQAMLESRFTSNPTQADDLGSLLAFAGEVAVHAATPLIVAIVVTALGASLMQVGFLITPRPLMPRFSRISPMRGMKNLIDMRAAMRLAMSVLKVVMIAAVAAFVVRVDLPRITTLAQLPLMHAFGSASQIVFWLAVKLAILLLVLAVLDYSFQRWKHEQDLRMSKQEVKDDMKRMEGDPLIKQRRSRVARQLALQRIRQDVPRADVIVTNPTHYAVALRYDTSTMRAPKVIAKGADFLAMRIRQIAIAHEVTIVERPELARAIYRDVEIGQEIPPQLYSAVAEILAYVYRVGASRMTA